MEKSSPRAMLRAGTAPWHDRVDALFTSIDPHSPAGYAAFLAAQAQAYLPIEAALAAQGAETLLPGWTQACRAAMLLADLQALRCPPPATTQTPPAFDTCAAVLGGLYVLEGSRLGGTMIARALPPQWPQGFLSARRPDLWRRLIQIIDERLTDPEEIDDALRAARQVFDRFAASGEQYLKAA